jgi:hypothetical protein
VHNVTLDRLREQMDNMYPNRGGTNTRARTEFTTQGTNNIKSSLPLGSHYHCIIRTFSFFSHSGQYQILGEMFLLCVLPIATLKHLSIICFEG